jgi:hypothetical protein
MQAAGPKQIKELMNVDCLNAELNPNLQQLASQDLNADRRHLAAANLPVPASVKYFLCFTC